MLATLNFGMDTADAVSVFPTDTTSVLSRYILTAGRPRSWGPPANAAGSAVPPHRGSGSLDHPDRGDPLLAAAVRPPPPVHHWTGAAYRRARSDRTPRGSMDPRRLAVHHPTGRSCAPVPFVLLRFA